MPRALMTKKILMMTKKFIAALLILLASDPVYAWTYQRGRTAVKINGFAAPGLMQPDFKDGDFVGDWRLRGQMNYATARGQSLGAVYSVDALATSEGHFARDAFVFYEMASYGRVELGLTDSIAKKLGVGLPDVGGLRINDQSLIYKEIRPDGAVIADTTLGDGRYGPRINVASIPRSGMQYGLSLSALDSHYDFATDAAVKIRMPNGTLKTAFTLGASYIDSPDNMRVGTGAQNLTADWRAQATAGLNLQYKGWIMAATVRLVYDRDAVGRPSDGIAAGVGASYDLLKYTISATYLFSDTGIWDNHPAYANHTVLTSLRYKYSEHVDGWVSLGLSTDTPFVAAGMRLTF